MTQFTYQNYIGLLKYIREELGREIVNFNNVPEHGDAYVILRHDIDFSLQKAVEMAQLEYDAGISATFFILLTTPYYNPLTEDGISQVKEIAALGHEIGLHYDCTGFELLTDAQIQKRVTTLANMLEDVSGMPVQTIAQHKPAKSPVRKEFPEFRNAYSPEYFSDRHYISDSRQMFLHEDVYDFFKRNKKAQLLIHPIWWNKEHIDIHGVFEMLQGVMGKGLEKNLAMEEESINNFKLRLKERYIKP